jgi:hypothetical protein
MDLFHRIRSARLVFTAFRGKAAAPVVESGVNQRVLAAVGGFRSTQFLDGQDVSNPE